MKCLVLAKDQVVFNGKIVNTVSALKSKYNMYVIYTSKNKLMKIEIVQFSFSIMPEARVAGGFVLRQRKARLHSDRAGRPGQDRKQSPPSAISYLTLTG